MADQIDPLLFRLSWEVQQKYKNSSVKDGSTYLNICDDLYALHKERLPFDMTKAEFRSHMKSIIDKRREEKEKEEAGYYQTPLWHVLLFNKTKIILEKY